VLMTDSCIFFRNSLHRFKIDSSTTKLKIGLRTIGIYRRISNIAVALLLLFMSLCSWTQDSVRGDVKFEVVSIRRLSEKEAERNNRDCIDCSDIAVRVRLSTGQYGIRFYGAQDEANPATYMIDCTGLHNRWMHGRNIKEWPISSPGLKEILFGDEGRWILLQPNSVIEWEELDSTRFGGQVHAFTVFLRDGFKGDRQEREVKSTTFIVPTR